MTICFGDIFTFVKKKEVKTLIGKSKESKKIVCVQSEFKSCHMVAHGGRFHL